jgi:hypothetical protein
MAEDSDERLAQFGIFALLLQALLQSRIKLVAFLAGLDQPSLIAAPICGPHDCQAREQERISVGPALTRVGDRR